MSTAICSYMEEDLSWSLF